MDTLAVQLTIPLTGLVGDLHSLESAPCRAHIIVRAREADAYEKYPDVPLVPRSGTRRFVHASAAL